MLGSFIFVSFCIDAKKNNTFLRFKEKKINLKQIHLF